MLDVPITLKEMTARSTWPYELEAIEVPPGEIVRLPRGATAAAALLVERGTLEGYWNPPSAPGTGRGPQNPVTNPS